MSLGKTIMRLFKRALRFIVALLDQWKPMIIGGLLVYLGQPEGGGGHSSGGIAELLRLLSTELGLAFLVAAILFVILEEWSARHHAKTAIGLLYGVRPQGWFFDKIEDYVLKQGFYRSKVVVTYAFEEQSDEDILVRQSIRYTVTNVCAKDDFAALPICGRVDLKPLHTGPTPWDDELGLVGLEIDDERVPDDKIRREKDEKTRSQSWEVIDKPLVDYLKSRTVSAVHKVVKHNHDAAVWSSTIPSTDVELCVTWKDPIRLNFAFSATHPELGNLLPDAGANSLTVTLENVAFLKGHGIHFWWGPPSDGPAPADLGAAEEGTDLTPQSVG